MKNKIAIVSDLLVNRDFTEDEKKDIKKAMNAKKWASFLCGEYKSKEKLNNFYNAVI